MMARLDPLPPWLGDDTVQRLMRALDRPGRAPRFVGGCVRDALLGRAAADIDVATPLPPDRVMAALAAAAFKTVPTGIAHGTVTAVADGRAFEVTTLRVDVETDGRRAVVAFTDDWQADAARRDFTMNALSAEADGTLYDYFGGVADARAGRVRFVGDPVTRIAEDALRIVRFFRFYAHFGRGRPDAAAFAACAAAATRVDSLSGERLRAETLKLLAAPDPVPAWTAMAQAGVAARLIGSDGRTGRLAALVAAGGPVDPLLRLAALLPGDPRPVADRLRLSNAERLRLSAALDAPLTAPPDAPALRRLLYRDGRPTTLDRLRLAAAERRSDGAYADAIAMAEDRPVPTFPLRGRDAVARGLEGPAVGRALAAVERWWIEGDFAADRAACLGRLATIAAGESPMRAG
jgi:poly(A) polymerase